MSGSINSLGQQQQELKYIPNEIMLVVFTHLTRRELFQAMRVCKEWLIVAQDYSLWKKEFTVLHIKDNLFSSLSSKINLLKKCVDDILPLLSKKSKTADELVLEISRASQVGGQSMMQLMETYGSEMCDKLNLHDSVKNGCLAASQLYELNLKPLTLLKEYADFLSTNHLDQKGLFWMAGVHIRKNNFVEALAILYKLETSPEKISLINQMVANYCVQNKFQEAIDLLVKFSQEKFAVSDEAVNTVLAHAGEAKNLAVIENAIDKIVKKSHKIAKIFFLIDSYFKANRDHEVTPLLQKYSKDLEEANKNQRHKLIDIYVRLKMIPEAWELAKKHAESDPMILYVLRNKFEEFNLQTEAKKVEELLPTSK